ncbi:MAG: creatininase family protein [Pseudomonadota bacterium]
MVEVEWQRLKAHELRQAADAGAVVIIPTAAIEQHGPHLPVMADTRIGHEIAVRAARAAYPKRPTLVTPVVWSGLSEHHMPFGGTLTLDHETFFNVLRCLVESLVRHGFRHVVISNSHGGNIIAVQAAADRLATETDATIVATTYVAEAGPAIGDILEDQPHIMHACEGETSMLLTLVPDLVDQSDLAGLATPRQSALSAGHASFRWRPYTSVTGNGLTGNPARASAEKGERLLDVASAAIADLITNPETFAVAGDKRPDAIAGVPFRDRLRKGDRRAE